MPAFSKVAVTEVDPCVERDGGRAVGINVERGLEIVSEAANYIRKGKHGLLFDDDFANELQASVGNTLRHEYEVVEAHTIWQVVTEMLPIVKKRVEILLREGVLDQMPDTNDWRKLRGRGVRRKPSG